VWPGRRLAARAGTLRAAELHGEPLLDAVALAVVRLQPEELFAGLR
jgi:hypothetical protein